MLFKLLRSIIIGLILAALILLLKPEWLKKSSWLVDNNQISDSQPLFSFNPAVRRAAPAVVNVYNRNTTNGNNHTGTTLGSGVLINQRGYILTNRHVINNADQIIIALQDGRFFEAMLVGSDAMTDLAVLKISASNLPVIPFDPEQQSHVGDVVMAIGNPYNLGQTVTQGIISATGRIGLSSSGRQNFLQTDASINQGNSGGALINSRGQLVGINTLTFDKSSNGETPEGIGFAIPSQLALKIMNKLIRDGRVIRGYIGITVRDLPTLMNGGHGYEKVQGLLVNQVTGPAADAGILPNDVILSINNKLASSPQETMDQVAEIRPGSTVQVQILRQTKKLEIPVTIQEYPEPVDTTPH